jgi:hypothetical protein
VYMKEAEVVDFEVLRIQAELDRYQRTKSLPHIILDGVYSLDDISRLYNKLSKKHQYIADRLQKQYTILVGCDADELKKLLKKEYSYTVANLATTHNSFEFSCIRHKYRKNINPVRALYYELREVLNKYNPDNPHHDWVLGLFADTYYKNIVLDALLKDIQRLEKIIKRYYIPVAKHTNSIPLELLHAKQLVSDFRHYYDVFSNFNELKL